MHWVVVVAALPLRRLRDPFSWRTGCPARQDPTQPFMVAIMRIHRDQRGVTAIEYALLVALIALAILVAITSTGLGNGGIWSIWTGAFLEAIGAGGN